MNLKSIFWATPAEVWMKQRVSVSCDTCSGWSRVRGCERWRRLRPGLCRSPRCRRPWGGPLPCSRPQKPAAGARHRAAAWSRLGREKRRAFVTMISRWYNQYTFSSKGHYFSIMFLCLYEQNLLCSQKLELIYLSVSISRNVILLL